MKDNRSVEERVAYRSYVGLCIDTKDDGPEVQEGWEAARDGVLPTKNPYRISTFKKVIKAKGGFTKDIVLYPIRGGKERIDKMLRWRDGYNAWVEMFGGEKTGWAM